MELRAYAGIIRRRWPAVFLLPLIALVAVILLDLDRCPNHTAHARISMNRISPSTTPDQYEYDDYYDLLASDFLLDDTVEVVRGNVFAAAVSERLIEQGVVVPPDLVDSALTASREHRILTIAATNQDSGLAVIIANVASLELRENFDQYIGQADEPLPVTMRPVDIPTNAESDTLRIRLLYAIAVVVSAGFGFLLALLLELFDDSLDRASAAEATGLRVLGAVQEDRL